MREEIKAWKVEAIDWENGCRKCGMMVWQEGRTWHLRLELFWRILNDRIRDFLEPLKVFSSRVTSECVCFRNLNLAAGWKMKRRRVNKITPETRPGLLNHITLIVGAQCREGLDTVPCRIGSSISCLYPLDTSCDNKTCFQTLPTVSWRAELPIWEPPT